MADCIHSFKELSEMVREPIVFAMQDEWAFSLQKAHEMVDRVMVISSAHLVHFDFDRCDEPPLVDVVGILDICG